MRSAPVHAVGLALLVAACGRSPRGLVDGRIELPAALREVSGIVAVDERTLACVQDEAGIVFYVDLAGERAVRAVPFGEPGDYEGLAWTGSELWVLRSDGRLLRLAPSGRGLAVTATFRLPDVVEYEGLCYDHAHNRLLALPKGPVNDRKRERDKRRVYAFDLAQELALAEPVLTVDLDQLVEQAAARGLELPTRTTRKGKQRAALKLLGSEVAVVPGSGDLLVLSAVDHLLARLDREGHLLATALLDGELLPQPEAMAFLPDGRLLIASEGRDGTAVAVLVAVP